MLKRPSPCRARRLRPWTRCKHLGLAKCRSCRRHRLILLSWVRSRELRQQHAGADCCRNEAPWTSEGPSPFGNPTQPHCQRRHILSDIPVCGAPAIPDVWPGSSFQVTAVVALIATWCLLAVAAIVTASVRRFEGVCIYFVAAGVAVGLAIAGAILLAP